MKYHPKCRKQFFKKTWICQNTYMLFFQFKVRLNDWTYIRMFNLFYQTFPKSSMLWSFGLCKFLLNNFISNHGVTTQGITSLCLSVKFLYLYLIPPIDFINGFNTMHSYLRLHYLHVKYTHQNLKCYCLQYYTRNLTKFGG